MAESILNRKKLLIVDEEPDVLAIVEEEILTSCPGAKIDKANNYESAAELLKSEEYDIVVLDIMDVCGFELLEIAVGRNFKVAVLTAHVLNSEALEKSHDMGAMAYLPKEKLSELLSFLEDVMRYDFRSCWKRLLDKLEKYYDSRFEAGWKDRTSGYRWALLRHSLR
jgi:DNA-binding response OmpR family regulator